MRQKLLSWLSDLATAGGGGSLAASHGDSEDGPRLRGSRRRSLRSFVLALACGLVLALLNGSPAWAYRPGGGQSFAAPPPRPAAVASPRVSTPRPAPRPPSPAPGVVRPAGGWSIPTPAAPQAPVGEAVAAPDPAPPYQPSKSPTVFAVLMLVGGSAAVGLALSRSRASGASGRSGASGASGNPWDVEHGVGNAPGGTAGSPGAPVGPLPLMGDLVQGKYRVGRELERDEFGATFQGFHEGLDAHVRLYFLLPEHADSQAAQARLFERVRGWASTREPNHRVVDAGTMEDGRPFVVFVEEGAGRAPVETVRTPVGPLPVMGTLVQGKYRVGRELERDEFGVMFEASQEHLNIPLRLSFLLPEHADSPVVQAQLWEMVRGWASTGDPNHRVADAGTMEDGRLFVVLGA